MTENVPTKIEKDAVTGNETTGHEWDGIQELDTAAAEMVAVSLLACMRLRAVI